MSVSQPQDINRRFAELYNSQQPEAARDLYEPDAVLISRPGGSPIVGIDAIMQELRQFMGLGGNIDFVQRYCVVAREIALIRADWHLTNGVDPAGNPVEMRGSSAEILRRQSDGTWRYVVDHAVGANHEV